MPTYSYRPVHAPSPGTLLRSASAFRSRLYAGDTYFRSRGVGQEQNLLAVQVIDADAACVITNYDGSVSEQLTGPATAQLLRVGLPPSDYIEIDQLHTPAPRARRYSISFKIAPPPPTLKATLSFSFSRVLSIPGQLSAKLTPGKAVFTASDKIVIKPRYRVYRLAPFTAPPDPVTGLPGVSGWGIADLRAQVNASDPWVEMLERAFTGDPLGGPPVPNPNPPDVQDVGADGPVLTPFPETFLTGGDGLPLIPGSEKTGPTRAIIHLNYSEAQNGALNETNVIYEWAGVTALDGRWALY